MWFLSGKKRWEFTPRVVKHSDRSEEDGASPAPLVQPRIPAQTAGPARLRPPAPGYRREEKRSFVPGWTSAVPCRRTGQPPCPSPHPAPAVWRELGGAAGETLPERRGHAGALLKRTRVEALTAGDALQLEGR